MGGTQLLLRYTYQKILSLNQIKLLDLFAGILEIYGMETQGSYQQNPAWGTLYRTNDLVSSTNKKEVEEEKKGREPID